MGIWFLGASIGNFLGGQAASFYETLPLPTLEILEREAAVYGWRKGQLLEALLMEKLGMGIHLERKPTAPKYKFKSAAWTESQRWIWYVRPDLKAKFDALRVRAGNIKPQAWIVLTANQFVGLPTL